MFYRKKQKPLTRSANDDIELAYCEQCKRWKVRSEFNLHRGTDRGITEKCTECLNREPGVRPTGRQQLKQSDWFTPIKRRFK